MTITVFSTMNMSMGFVVSLTYSIPFPPPGNEVMHPVFGARFNERARRIVLHVLNVFAG